MTDKEEPVNIIMEDEPSDEYILGFIGKAKRPWLEFTSFLDDSYDFTPEKINYGKKSGWAIRYRKSNKTWCALYPQKDCFQVQIIFGKKEVEKFQEQRKEFGNFVLNKFDSTRQLHDGRWMFFTIDDMSLIEDLKKMMIIKKRPKKKKE